MQPDLKAWPTAVQRLRTTLFIVLFWSFAIPSTASERTLENEVKAAMLYKFLSYIEWPSYTFNSEQSPYRVAVVDADAIAEQLKLITANRRVNHRPIEIVELKEPGLLADIHMLFIGGQKKRGRREINALIELAQQYSIVTVTENVEGMEEGSTINLRVNGGRVNFDVSLAASEARNIKVSARMLAVASSVKRRSK